MRPHFLFLRLPARLLARLGVSTTGHAVSASVGAALLLAGLTGGEGARGELSSGAAPLAQAALARELAPKVNRFQWVWQHCPEARLRGPATMAFRRWVARSVDLAGDKSTRRQWLRSLPAIDARAFGAEAGGTLVVATAKACELPPSPWSTSVRRGSPTEPEDLLSTGGADGELSSATVVGAPVPETLFAALEGAAMAALFRAGRVVKPFAAYASAEEAARAATKLGGTVVRLFVAPGAAAGADREFRIEGAHWRWMEATALRGAADVPLGELPVSDVIESAASVTSVDAWKRLLAAMAAAGPLLPELLRAIELAATSTLPEPGRRALGALAGDAVDGATIAPAEAFDVLDPLVGIDEALDRRIVERLVPGWVLRHTPVANWMERIALAHPDAILNGWSPAILDDDARLAAAWVGAGAHGRRALVERAAARELPERTLGRIAEVARLDREPSVRAATAMLDHAVCVRQGGATNASKCGFYGIVLGLLADEDTRVRYAAREQVRYRIDVRGHRIAGAAELAALLEPLPNGPGEIVPLMPLLRAGAETEAFSRWAWTSEGRRWARALATSEAPGADELRQWAVDALGSLEPPAATQAGLGLPAGAPTRGATPPELEALVASAKKAPAPSRQPAAVEPTVSTIDRVVELDDSADAAPAREGRDDVAGPPLMPPGP